MTENREVKNDELLEKCKVLSEYTQFIERVRNTEEAYGEETITKAIDWAINHNILKDFLKARGAEVLKSMTIDMRFEKREKLIREEERAAGYENGIEQGTLNTLIDLVKSDNLDIEIAAEKAGMNVSDFMKLYEK